MNAHDGHVYELGEDLLPDVPVGGLLSEDFLEKLSTAERALSSDELAAARDLAEGAPIVRVDPAAAQRARLGDRELRRRRQRRR